MKISDIQTGHKFSEQSHYTAIEVSVDYVKFMHHGSGKTVTLSHDYVKEFLSSAEQYDEIIKVGKEDKFWTARQIQNALDKGEFTFDNAPMVGDLRLEGIRTIWENIHSQKVFTVCFLANSKETNTELTKRRQETASNIAGNYNINSKMRVGELRNIIKTAIIDAYDNPVIKEFRERILRGFKIQFTSRDGKYNCIDMDISNNNNIRPVNINTIQWLVVDGIKYIIE